MRTRHRTNNVVLVQCSQGEPTRDFGPFTGVGIDEVEPAGFRCQHCGTDVERARKVVPGGVPRMCFFACPCGCVVVWEDERQPTQRRWWHAIKLLKRSGAKVAIFNGDKTLPPDFSGLN